MTGSWPTYLLDGVLFLAIGANGYFAWRLRRKGEEVDRLIGELRFKGEELARARDSLTALAKRYATIPKAFADAVDAYADLHLGDENGRRS